MRKLRNPFTRRHWRWKEEDTGESTITVSSGSRGIRPLPSFFCAAVSSSFKTLEKVQLVNGDVCEIWGFYFLFIRLRFFFILCGHLLLIFPKTLFRNNLILCRNSHIKCVTNMVFGQEKYILDLWKEGQHPYKTILQPSFIYIYFLLWLVL